MPRALATADRMVTHSHYHPHATELFENVTEPRWRDLIANKHAHGHWHAHDDRDRENHNHNHGLADKQPHDGCAVEQPEGPPPKSEKPSRRKKSDTPA